MIAVTGGAGFIGSCLVHRLASQGADALVVDAEVSGDKAANLIGLDRAHIVGHRDFLAQLASGRVNPEAIFHLGACSSTTESNWDYLLENNVVYSQRLWEWCAENGRPYYYASSAATYGDGKRGFDDRIPPEQLQPLNLYGRSKNEFDKWVLEQVRSGRPTPPKWAGFKFFNVYGPRERHKGPMASVVWKAFCQIKETGSVRLFKSTDPAIRDGEQSRDFVFVEDCIGHLLWAWRRGGASGIYNSGSGAPRTFLELVNAVFDSLGRPRSIQFIDMPPGLAAQYQNFTRADMSKLRKIGCDVPATSLEAGVRKTVEAYEQMEPLAKSA